MCEKLQSDICKDDLFECFMAKVLSLEKDVKKLQSVGKEGR